jgi:hypothetical protein
MMAWKKDFGPAEAQGELMTRLIIPVPEGTAWPR